MNKITWKSLQNKSDTERETTLFLAFCRALEQYCDQVGITNPNFSAVRILHDAAYNTVAGMQRVTPTQHRHMVSMTQNIPEMLDGLIKIVATRNLANTVESMSNMSLAQLAAIVAENNHKR